MSNLNEIKKALSFFPKNKVTLLHCISSYPTLKKDANLINISYLKNKFKVSTGYSDHVPGIETAAKSIFFGAQIIEKHFMPKKTKLAGDYKLSIDFIDLKRLINLIKENLEIIGFNRNKYFNCEKYGIKTLRRSIYFLKNLNKGDKIKKDDIILLRPFSRIGVEIKDLNKILGTTIKKKVKKNQLLTYKVLKF